MSIVAIDVHDVGETDHINLLLATSASRVYWKENRPSHTASYERYEAERLEISEEQKSVHRLMLQDESIMSRSERLEPPEKARTWSRRYVPARSTNITAAGERHTVLGRHPVLNADDRYARFSFEG